MTIDDLITIPVKNKITGKDEISYCLNVVTIGDIGNFPEVFRAAKEVPTEFKMTQEEWDNATKLCLEARLRGKWIGNDILHPNYSPRLFIAE